MGILVFIVWVMIAGFLKREMGVSVGMSSILIIFTIGVVLIIKDDILSWIDSIKFDTKVTNHTGTVKVKNRVYDREMEEYRYFISIEVDNTRDFPILEDYDTYMRCSVGQKINLKATDKYKKDGKWVKGYYHF